MDTKNIFPKVKPKKLHNMIHLKKNQQDELLEELENLGKFSKQARVFYQNILSLHPRKQESIEQAMMLTSTTRNKLLITDVEQQKLARTTVGFFGLSVGSHAALTWMMLSRAQVIKIADPDIISPSNLNRLRLGWSTIGKRKVDVIKNIVLDMHPYVSVHTLTKTQGKLMEAFCRTKPRVDCIVDEIDDLEGKVQLRSLARNLRIPLISAVDVGENVIVDIERYDTERNTKFFLGRIPDIEHINLATLTPLQKARLIISLVGLDHNSSAMLTSLFAIGREIGTWPQLGSTATIAGGIIATTIKRITLGESIKSGRYVFDMDTLFGLSEGVAEKKRLQKLKKNIHVKFGI